jgi:hypothetical protein
MTIALRSALRSTAFIRNTVLPACVSVVSLHAQMNATGTAPPKTLATNAKTAKPTATTAKPAAASAAKQKGNAGAAPQASAQVANSVGLVPAAAQTPIPSPPAAAKPNVATPSPVPNATVPAATPGASPARGTASQLVACSFSRGLFDSRRSGKCRDLCQFRRQWQPFSCRWTRSGNIPLAGRLDSNSLRLLSHRHSPVLRF